MTTNDFYKNFSNLFESTQKAMNENDEPSLYQELKNLDVEMDNHESDLYVEKTSEVMDILSKPEYKLEKKNASVFKDQITGKPMLEIPFAYDPFFGKKSMYTNKRKKMNENVDEEAAKELVLFIENDGDLSRRHVVPMIENLAKKKVRGVFDNEKAVKLFEYLTEAGAKKYNVEHGHGKPTPVNAIFDKQTRRAAASELLDRYMEEIEERAEEIKQERLNKQKSNKTNEKHLQEHEESHKIFDKLLPGINKHISKKMLGSIEQVAELKMLNSDPKRGRYYFQTELDGKMGLLNNVFSHGATLELHMTEHEMEGEVFYHGKIYIELKSTDHSVDTSVEVGTIHVYENGKIRSSRGV